MAAGVATTEAAAGPTKGDEVAAKAANAAKATTAKAATDAAKDD